MQTLLPAECYEFFTRTQEQDGPLLPPEGDGWALLAVCAAEDADAAVVIATWARLKKFALANVDPT